MNSQELALELRRLALEAINALTNRNAAQAKGGRQPEEIADRLHLQPSLASKAHAVPADCISCISEYVALRGFRLAFAAAGFGG